MKRKQEAEQEAADKRWAEEAPEREKRADQYLLIALLGKSWWHNSRSPSEEEAWAMSGMRDDKEWLILPCARVLLHHNARVTSKKPKWQPNACWGHSRCTS